MSRHTPTGGFFPPGPGRGWAWAWLLGWTLAACSPGPEPECNTDRDCEGASMCLDGVCRARARAATALLPTDPGSR